MLKNFKIVKGESTTVEEILRDLTEDKENSNIQNVPNENELGLVVKDLFGDSIVVSRKVSNENNGRTRVYQNLHKEIFKFEQFSFHTGSTYHGWTLLSITNERYKFTRATDYTINDNRYSPDLEINTASRSITVTGMDGIKICEMDLYINKCEITSLKIAFLLLFLSKLKLCVGFTGNGLEKVIRTENDKICCKRILGSPTESSVNITSKRCKLFVCTINLNNQSRFCLECSRIKKTLSSRKLEYKNIKQTKNCYLGRDEMAEKMRILEQEKRNATKRATYWQKKFQSVAMSIDDDDDDDLSSMLKGIDESNVPSGFELLLRQQKKALSAKGPSGRRWHPQ